MTAYSVAQRTHEIGIRMAVGARPVSIYALLLGKQLRYTCVALALGLSAALMLTRLMSALLFGVRPRDPLTYILTSLLLTIVALAACYIPSRRAAKLDPLIALRYEYETARMMSLRDVCLLQSAQLKLLVAGCDFRC